MRINKSNYLIKASVLALVISVFGFSFKNAAAIDTNFYSSNGIYFFEPGSSNVCTYTNTGVSSNVDYAGNKIFTTAQLAKINQNRPFYQSAVEKVDIPWQLLAAIHLRENNLSRDGPDNSQGPYQIASGGYKQGAYSDDEFQKASDEAAEFVKNKIGDLDLSDPENVKTAFFKYNGAATVYVTQAINLGFTQEEADRGEGSPYVMNKYDEARDPSVKSDPNDKTWGQIVDDYGEIEYPARNGHYGAFVYYSALSGVGLCNDGSVGSSGDPKDAEQVQKNFIEYMNSNNNTYNGYILGSNGCTTMSAWYIGTYTNLTYGRGDGADVVKNLISANKGLKSSTEPVAPSIFSVARGHGGTWGASTGAGNKYGHVGVVLSVDASKKEATVLHTGSSGAKIPNKSWIQTYKYPTEGVTFTYIGDNLK